MLKKSLLLMLLMALLVPWAAKAQTLTVSDGTDVNQFIPLYAYSGDTEGTTSEFIIPASDLSAMTGNAITQLTFYLSQHGSKTWTAIYQVYLKEVAETTLSSNYGPSSCTVVYTGTIDGSVDETTIVFDEEYVYNGGNLLIGTYISAAGAWDSNGKFYGTTVTGAAYMSGDWGGYSTGAKDFIPKTTFTYSKPETCFKPTDLTATNITTESATLGWTAPDPAPDNGYNIRYRTAEYREPYYFNDFNDGTAPVAWTFSGNMIYGFADPIYGVAGDDNYFLSMGWSTTTEEVIISSVLPPYVAGSVVEFYYFGYVYDNTFQVGYSSTTNDYSAFTWGSAITAPAGEYTKYNEVLAAGTKYVAFKATASDQYYSVFIDDFGIFGPTDPAGEWVNTTSNTTSKTIAGLNDNTLYDFEVQSNCGGSDVSKWAASTFTTLPSCMPVTNLAVSEVTATTISLTWTDTNDGNASYIVTDGGGDPYTVTDLTVTGCTITKLDANTEYTIMVSADCGSSAETIYARTACEAISSIPYSDGFETDTYYCWDITGFERWNNATYAHTGSRYLIADGSDDTTPYYAIMPETNADLSILMLRFWYYNYNSGVDCGTLYVGYVTDVNDITTFTAVETIDMSSGTNVYLHTDDIVFTGAPVGSRIAFNYEASGEQYAYLFIDDVTLEYKPACMRPTDLVASNPTAHGATFAWDGNGSAAEDGWQLYISEDADAVSGYDSPAGVIDADTNPFTVTSGLDPETTYYVWVRSHCEYQGYSPWSDPATFTTTEACPAPTGLEATEITGNTAKLSWTGTSESYTVKYRTAAYMDTPVLEEDFSAAPSDWTFTQGALANDGTATLSGTSSWTRGTNCGVFDTHIYMNMYSTKNYWLITPSMTIADGYLLNFDMAYTKYSSAGTNTAPATGCTTHRFAVLISTDDKATWTILREWNNSGSPYVLDAVSQTGQNSGDIDLSAYAGETAYIAFFGHSETTSYDNNFHFDNVTIGTSVPAGAWQTKNADASPYTLTGLTAETYYEAKVQGNCGSEGTSDESASVFFTTSAACPEQDGLEASNLQMHSAVISWDAHGADEWNLRYSNDNGTTWTEITKAITNPYTLEELNAATDYLVQVQAKCAASDEWSASVAFTTKCDFVTTFPWSEDFESYTAGNFNATCWVNEHVAGSATTNLFKVYTSTTGTNTTHQLQLPDEATGNMIKLVLPGMTLPNNNYAFYIDVYRSNSTYSPEDNPYEGIRVFASTNGEIEGATELAFIPRQYDETNGSIPAESEVGWYTYMLPINMSGNCYIILRGESRYCTSTYMDNFMVSACAPVGTLSYDNLASQTVDLHWTLLDNTQDAWQVCINGDEDHPIDITESDVVVEGVERTYSMSGLTAETPYTVKVRANCGGGDFGKWSNTISFTTLAACAKPTGLAASNLTQIGADLAWTGSSDVDYYTVQYRTAAGNDGSMLNENFNSLTTAGTIPTNWNNDEGTTTSTNYKWCHNDKTSGNGNPNGTSHDGSNCVVFNSYMNGNGNTNFLKTPSMDFPTGKTMQLTFWWKNPTGGDFSVYISTDGGTTKTPLKEGMTGQSTWKQEAINLTDYIGASNVTIHFKGTSNYGSGDAYIYLDDVVIGEVLTPGAWQTAADDVATWNYELTGLTAGIKYDARVYANCATDPDTENDMTTFTTLEEHNIVFPGTGNWAAGNFEPTGAPTIDDDVIIRANVTVPNGTNALANNINLQNGSVITVAAGATLTINGTVTNGGSDKIIIEDGGQLIHNTSINATVKKNITAPAVWKGTSDADGWYLIATPVYSSTIASTFTGTIDLFKYNEPTAYWWSYNNGSHTFSNMSRGTGYLHASQTSQTVNYAGSMISTESAESISLSYAYDGSSTDVKGFNLIGNPFTRNLVLGDMSIGSNPVTTIYVIKDEDRTKLTAVTTDEYEVKPGEGFFVQATALNQMVKLNPSAKDEFEFRYIKIVAGNENGSDNAYIQLENGNTLNKMNIANKTSVYVVDGGENLAATTINELAGSMPVHFKAIEDGVYKISFNTKYIEASTMLLYDNFTGETIDLLEAPNYTFKAAATDDENRFKLMFDFNNYAGVDENTTGSTFAYQTGDEIFVNGEGTLQVFDVMGRFVTSMEIHGNERISTSQFNTGVYVFRMVGETVMTQKLIVR